MRSSKTEQKTSSVTSAVWHIVPSCWHQTITIAIDCSGLSLHIFEEKWPNYVSGPKYAPNSDSFWVRRLLYICVRVCLFTYPSRLKWASSEKMIFFFAKIGIFCKMICRNISQLCSNAYTTIFVPRKDKTNYLSNQIWAKCYHSRNKHELKKNVWWQTIYFTNQLAHQKKHIIWLLPRPPARPEIIYRNAKSFVMLSKRTLFPSNCYCAMYIPW